MQAIGEAFSSPDGLVCSYASFGSELNTSLLNSILLKRKCLVLPRVEHKDLDLYLVLDIDADMEISSLGFLEPKASCIKARKEDLSLILVPGLAFDSLRHRLGYGKGYYDRFLAGIAEETKTVGVGFRESFIKETLPTHKADTPLKDLAFF